MRFVPGFFTCLCYLIFSGSLAANVETARLHACEHSVTLTDFRIDPTPGDSLRATVVHGNRLWTLLILCRPNIKKTNPGEELILEAKERGDVVRDVTRIPTQLGTALIFKRTSRETLVMRLEGNQASREFVYLYVLIPEKGKNVGANDWLEMEKLLGQIVSTSKSENQTAAITEENFRMRLLGSLILLVLLLIAGTWFAVRRIAKVKRSHKSQATQADSIQK
ncbi:MAG: hypothetical protein K8S54_08800 [Spirochaetia bacterium]|nr:hypothetical protein [Spirochaetia bacterium]